jgi:hypothetical protein
MGKLKFLKIINLFYQTNVSLKKSDVLFFFNYKIFQN